MKNGLLIWNLILTIATCLLLFWHFKGTTPGKVKSAKMTNDTASHTGAVRIAYFEMDSIEANFDMVKDVKAEIGKKDDEYSRSLIGLDNTYKKKVQEYQSKANTMTPADYENAQKDLKSLEERLKRRQQELDKEYQEYVMRRNMSVKKKIEDYLTEFNKTKSYSYIISYEPGLIYYRDTAYNITSDLVRGLNDAYKKDKK